MRFNKLFSTKSITNLLYGFLLLMPFCAVLGRLIYTQANINAKDSYSQKIVTNVSKVQNTNFFVPNSIYQFNDCKTRQVTGTNGSYNLTFEFSYISLDINTILGTEDKIYTKMSVSDWGNETRYIFTYKNELNEYVDLIRFWNYTQSTPLYPFTFKLVNFESTSFNTEFLDLSLLTYSYDSLDNAFEYSLSTFTADNNFGNVDFFGWFTNLFLNQSNSHNAVYLNFANWYMNYALLVSSGYLIFMALIWFINYVRKIMDKSMNHDFGGF